MRILVLFISAFFLASCSSVSIGYRFADWAIEDRVDSYLDLSSKQKDQLEKALDQYFQWHRIDMLPRYTEYLEKVLKAFEEENYQVSHWKQLGDELNKIYYDTAVPFKKILSPLFVAMNADQVIYLENKIKEDNKEKSEKYARPVDERQDEKTEENIETFDKWFGSVNQKQRLRIKLATRELSFPVESWLQKRKAQQKELLRLLYLENRDEAQFNEFLEDYIARKPTEATKLYYSEIDEFMGGFRLVFLDLIQNLEPKQREHFSKRMKTMIYELSKIHEKGKAS